MPDVPFQLLIPVAWSYQVTGRFNTPRRYPFAPTKLQLHEGIDFAPSGAVSAPLYVRASQRGIVDKIGFDANGYGNYARIVHQWGDERYVTWYGHFAQVTTEVNKYVNAGEIIGIAGSTGNSTGTHVHLTLQWIGHGLKNYVVDDVVDPEPYLTNSLLPFDEAWWVKDVTIPDGAKLTAGQAFQKTWRIRNAGSTEWGSGYSLAFFSDDRMGAPASVPLPRAKPGELVDVSVDLIAPMTPGIWRSTWKPRSAANRWFDYTQYAEIEVAAPPKPLIDEARYVADVTIPDGTVMKPGQPFRKTWRIRNSGQTEWGDGYTFAFFSGARMSGPESVPLPRTLPGHDVDVAVDLVAPSAPGIQRSTYKPRDPQGKFFEFEMYAEINVVPSTADSAAFVGDVIALQPGQTFRKTWRVQNTGQSRWTSGYALAFAGGDALAAPASVPIPDTKAGATADVSVTLTAPLVAGVYTSQWRLRSADGTPFGPTLSAQIEVKA